MKTYNFSSFEQALKELPLKRGDTVMVHSSLLSFGLPTDVETREIPARLFQTIQELIGQDGTLVVPTFNFDFCVGKPFDLQKTPSKGMGVFSEYLRNLVKSKRSFHPMQSVSVVGKLRDFIVENDTATAFSLEGAFDRIRNLEAKIILLGADINSVSMVHWVEERMQVPYRHWKSFSGSYINYGKKENRRYQMYVRSMDSKPVLNFNYIEKQLKKNEDLVYKKVGNGLIRYFELNDFLSIAEDCILQNPYFFVKNHISFEKKTSY